MIVDVPVLAGLEDPDRWVERWTAELSASLADGPRHERPAAAARLAAILLSCARDEEAETVLMTARRDAARSKDSFGLARLEVALAAAALTRDDDRVAETRLKEARAAAPWLTPSVEARAWVVEARRARLLGVLPPAPPEAALGGANDPIDPDERADAEAELALERAAVARETQDLRSALEALTVARGSVERSASVRHFGLFEVEVACLAALSGDIVQARERFRRAVHVLQSAGLARDEGRAMVRFADLLAVHGGGDPAETAASWLGRAQHVLGPAATWRDRLAIRTGFQSFGRRGFDRVMTEGTRTRIEAFERSRGFLVNALANVAHATDRALTTMEVLGGTHDDSRTIAARIDVVRDAARDQASQAMHAVTELDVAMRELVELIGAALLERDRLRALLNVLAEIDRIADEATFPSTVAALAGPLLDADRVVVALDPSGALTPRGEWGAAVPGNEDDWLVMAHAVASPSGVRASEPQNLLPRSGETLRGPRLAIAIRGRETRGLLYADKLRRNGQFREQDEAIAHLLAEYVAVAFGRLRAREEERFALHQLAVTLDTIRDGVVACDADGVVSSINAAAARMLQVRPEDVRGVRLDGVPQLGPLASRLAESPRLDGVVIRLDHASFVVTARPISAADASERGVVSTLVELDRAHKIAQRLSATRARYVWGDVIGTSPSLGAAVAMARRAATIEANVLLTGESGTGKEVIAQAIHTGGPRSDEPFIGVNCAAVPRELLEAELFGYEKGAFTGARTQGNVGKFELAAGGTILLDEVGDMPFDMQAKLLRVLQERVVTRLGGHREIRVEARVIATTHRDLARLVEEGTFRMDLYYRLRVLALELPPLRERHDDIAPLARHFLTRFAEQQRKRVRRLGPRVQDELERYDWPGNVRELANVMEAEVSLAPADADVLDRLATRLVGRFRTSTTAGSTGTFAAVTIPPAADEPIVSLAEVEKRAILRAIERCAGSVSKASEALAVSKVTLYAKLRSWGLHPKDRGEESGDGPSSARPSRR